MSSKTRVSTLFTPAVPHAERTAAGADDVEAVGRSAVALARTVSGAGSLFPQPALAPGEPSTDLVSQLNNIDFRMMIGGPLQAVVDAQVASSMATVDFIQRVGFDYPVTNKDGKDAPDMSKTPKLRMVNFTHYAKKANGSETPTEEEVKLEVPLLAMLPIPSLRIEQVTIDFNAKLNSVQTANVSERIGVGATAQGGWGPVSFKVSASYQRQTTTGTKVEKEYSLRVNVKAVQDEMPLGLERVLNALLA
jgi:hypothetical protein